MATMAYVPTIEVDKYEEQLDAKVSKVKTLFSDFTQLPDVEVLPPNTVMGVATGDVNV